MRRTVGFAAALALCCAAAGLPAGEGSTRPYWVCVSNEKSGTVTVMAGTSRKVAATIPVGKRPRGVHPSPDGQTLYVALSGSPITGPPKLDAKGNPIFEEEKGEADRSADGIGVVDLRLRKFIRKLPAGSDPEEFAVSKDGKRLYISNEDVATATVLRVDDAKVERIIPSRRSRRASP